MTDQRHDPQADRTEMKPSICDICNPTTHCGLEVEVRDGRGIRLRGLPDHPHSRGRLCPKGAAGLEYVYHPDRLVEPLVKNAAGEFEPRPWAATLDQIGDRLNEIKAQHGPESILFMAGYPKWMRPFLKRLALSFGSPNFGSESSTCSTAVTMAGTLTYGAFGLPDLTRSECLLVWSTNPPVSKMPLSRGLDSALERGLKMIEVGPLKTKLSEKAAYHLRIRPGTSGALALGMARVIIQEGLYDRDFVENWVHGFEPFRDMIEAFTPEKTAEITGVPRADIIGAARLFATTKPAAIMSGASPTVHHTNGVQNHRAIVALSGLTGNYDVAGGNLVNPPSYLYIPAGVPTRQMEFAQPVPFEELPPRLGAAEQPLWCRLTGEAQAVHLAAAIRGRAEPRIRAVVGFGLNHRIMPGSDSLAEALKELELFVNVDLFKTDTVDLAQIALPAQSSLERSELKFYPTPQVVWTQPAVEPVGQARDDAWIIAELARRIAPHDELLGAGHEAWIDWILEPAGLSLTELKKHPSGMPVPDPARPRERKYVSGGFKTPSGKMELASGLLAEYGYDPLPVFREPVLSPVSRPDLAEEYPLILTTGARVKGLIHSRMFRIPAMRKLHPHPTVEIHPEDARALGLEAGDKVRVETPRAGIEVRAEFSGRVPKGVVSLYHGWPEADPNILIEPDYLDPISGFPGYKSLLCRVVVGWD